MVDLPFQAQSYCSSCSRQVQCTVCGGDLHQRKIAEQNQIPSRTGSLTINSCLAIHIEPNTVVVKQTTIPANNCVFNFETYHKPKSTNFKRCSIALSAITNKYDFEFIMNRLSVGRARYTEFTTFPRDHNGVVVDFSSSSTTV